MNDKFANYVSKADLEDGIEVDDIEARSITIDGKVPSLEGHTHSAADITDISAYATQSWVSQQIQSAIGDVLASTF